MSLYNSYVSPANNNYNRDSFVDYQQQFQPTATESDGGLYDWMNSAYTGSTDAISGATDGMTMAGFNDFAQGAGGLYGMFQGHKMLGLYEDQVKDARLNSARMRSDMDRRDKTREAWGTAFSNAGK